MDVINNLMVSAFKTNLNTYTNYVVSQALYEYLAMKDPAFTPKAKHYKTLAEAEKEHLIYCYAKALEI